MSMLSLKLLGPPQVVVADGIAGKAKGHFRSAKELGLLAYLALETTTHPRESLITLLWPDQSDASARRNLSQTFTRLRRDLADLHKTDSLYFESTRQTLRLMPEGPIQCDLWQIDQVLTACSQHKHEALAQCPVCQAQLRQAAELTGGELLEGFTIPDSPTFEEWLLLAREFWFERQMGLLDHVTNGAMAAGQYGDAVRYARQQLALEPWRERAHHQIIQSLALNGERAAALAQFNACQRVLEAELGLSPSPATRTLVERIRAGTFPDAPEVRVVGPPREETHAPSNLPHRLTPFFGREEALQQMTERLRSGEYRLLTIAGQGGIGKTRFALEVASRQVEHFKDGVYWVPLAGTGRAEEIPNAVATALALPLNPQMPPAQQVVSFLQKRHLLLVLDNFEHLVEGAEWLVTLLEQAQRVTLLLTSRERLHMLAEDLFPLRGLPLPPPDASVEQAAAFASVRLFVDRARRFDKEFRLSPDNVQGVTRICHLVDGLPLGIELATSWSHEMSCQQIAAGISQSLDFIASSLRDLPARHRSLRAAFDHSWQLLSAEEQSVLPQLALFRGGFSLMAAEAVAGASPLLLDRLRHKSLLEHTEGGWMEMHELVRQFSAERLRQEPALYRCTSERHATFYLGQVATATYDGKHGSDELKALQQVLDNIYAAWQWALENDNTALLMNAADGMTLLHYESYMYYGGIAHVQAASQHLLEQQSERSLSDEEHSLLGKLLAREAGLWSNLNRYTDAKRVLEQAVAILPSNDDPNVVAMIAYQEGRMALHFTGHGRAALLFFEKGLAYAQRGNNRDVEVMILRDIGSVYRQRGDYVTFIYYLEECLRIVQAMKDARKEMAFLYFLGYYTVGVGDYWRGRHLLLAAQTLNEDIDSSYHRGAIDSSLGLATTLLGRPTAALLLFPSALAELQKMNEKWRVVMAYVEFASAQMQVEAYEEARVALHLAEQIAQQHNLAELHAHVTLAWAYLHFFSDRLAEAALLFASARQKMVLLERTIGEVEARVMQARCALESGDLDEVQHLVGDSLAYVAQQRLDGAYQRELLYCVAYRLATPLEAEQAAAILQAAKAFVASVVDGIEEEGWRTSYLARPSVQWICEATPAPRPREAEQVLLALG